MNVKNDYTWRSNGHSRRNTTMLLNLLLQPERLDYNHLYVFGRSLHQREYQILKKGFKNDLSKKQVENIFTS